MNMRLVILMGLLCTAIGSAAVEFDTIPLVAEYSKMISAQDFSGDGIPDILACEHHSGNSGPMVVYYESSPQGTLNQRIIGTVESDLITIEEVHAVDIDGDGDYDIAASGRKDRGNCVRYYLFSNNGQGRFTRTVLAEDTDYYRSSFTFTKINTDAQMSMVIASSRGGIYLYRTPLLNKNGPRETISIDTTREYNMVKCFDILGNGTHSIVLSASTAGWAVKNFITVFERDTNKGTYSEIKVKYGSSVLMSEYTKAFAFGDCNGDARSDLFISSGYANSLILLKNDSLAVTKWFDTTYVKAGEILGIPIVDTIIDTTIKPDCKYDPA